MELLESMNPATLPLHSTAVSAGNGTALSTLRMRSGTPALASRETKVARPSCPCCIARYRLQPDHSHSIKVSTQFTRSKCIW
jgi:hypothetical protein